jgi:hypothetical protein
VPSPVTDREVYAPPSPRPMLGGLDPRQRRVDLAWMTRERVLDAGETIRIPHRHARGLVPLERGQRVEAISATGDRGSVPACLDETVAPFEELFGGPQRVVRERPRVECPIVANRCDALHPARNAQARVLSDGREPEPKLEITEQLASSPCRRADPRARARIDVGASEPQPHEHLHAHPLVGPRKARAPAARHEAPSLPIEDGRLRPQDITRSRRPQRSWRLAARPCAARALSSPSAAGRVRTTGARRVHVRPKSRLPCPRAGSASHPLGSGSHPQGFALSPVASLREPTKVHAGTRAGPAALREGPRANPTRPWAVPTRSTREPNEVHARTQRGLGRSPPDPRANPARSWAVPTRSSCEPNEVTREPSSGRAWISWGKACSPRSPASAPHGSSSIAQDASSRAGARTVEEY